MHHRDNSEVHEECVKLEKKCTDQSNKIIRLATETGSAEQRTKELEGLLRESRDTHRSAMKTILDVVQERDSGEEGEQTDSVRMRVRVRVMLMIRMRVRVIVVTVWRRKE